MAEVTPIPAASVLLLRDDPLEVLMIRRHKKSSFVPDAWVFPGGAFESGDRELGNGDLLNGMRIAAARELFEETGIWLGGSLANAESKRQALMNGTITFRDLFRQSPIDLERLVWTGRWITPLGEPKRFDTYFFLACTGRHAVATVQESEAVDVTWISPAEAIERAMRDEFPIVFPTMKNLEAIVGFRSAAELIESRRNADIPTTCPIVVIENGRSKIVLP